MNKYPNLCELIQYHPYSSHTVCDHANIEPEVLQAALEGRETLTPDEVLAIARLYGCPAHVIDCAELIMLGMGKLKHNKMVMEIDSIYIWLKHMANEGNPKAEEYLEWAYQRQQHFLRAAHEDRLSYCHYLGIKEQLNQYVSFATPRPKRRSLTPSVGKQIRGNGK